MLTEQQEAEVIAATIAGEILEDHDFSGTIPYFRFILPKDVDTKYNYETVWEHMFCIMTDHLQPEIVHDNDYIDIKIKKDEYDNVGKFSVVMAENPFCIDNFFDYPLDGWCQIFDVFEHVEDTKHPSTALILYGDQLFEHNQEKTFNLFYCLK